MRSIFYSLLAVAATALALSFIGQASAKIGLELSPAAGPPGTTVHVNGFGFEEGAAVRVGLASAGGPLSNNEFFANDDSDFLQLSTATAHQGTFTATIVIPSQDVIASRFPAKQVNVVAITENNAATTERPEKFFLASQTFALSGPALAAAGTSDGTRGRLPSAWLSASLGVAGALLLAIGWRQRAR